MKRVSLYTGANPRRTEPHRASPCIVLYRSHFNCVCIQYCRLAQSACCVRDNVCVIFIIKNINNTIYSILSDGRRGQLGINYKINYTYFFEYSTRNYRFCCCDICDVCRVSRNRLLILPISPCVDGRAVKKRGLGPSEKHRDEKTTSRTQIAELSSRMVREMKDSFSFLFSLSVFLY